MAANVFNECSCTRVLYVDSEMNFCVKGLFLTNKQSVLVRVDTVIFFLFH